MARVLRIAGGVREGLFRPPARPSRHLWVPHSDELRDLAPSAARQTLRAAHAAEARAPDEAQINLDSGDDADLQLIARVGEFRFDADPRWRVARHHPSVPHRIHGIVVSDVAQP